jgi:hypothetical protein
VSEVTIRSQPPLILGVISDVTKPQGTKAKITAKKWEKATNNKSENAAPPLSTRQPKTAVKATVYPSHAQHGSPETAGEIFQNHPHARARGTKLPTFFFFVLFLHRQQTRTKKMALRKKRKNVAVLSFTSLHQSSQPLSLLTLLPLQTA